MHCRIRQELHEVAPFVQGLYLLRQNAARTILPAALMDDQLLKDRLHVQRLLRRIEIGDQTLQDAVQLLFQRAGRRRLRDDLLKMCTEFLIETRTRERMLQRLRHRSVGVHHQIGKTALCGRRGAHRLHRLIPAFFLRSGKAIYPTEPIDPAVDPAADEPVCITAEEA